MEEVSCTYLRIIASSLSRFGFGTRINVSRIEPFYRLTIRCHRTCTKEQTLSGANGSILCRQNSASNQCRKKNCKTTAHDLHSLWLSMRVRSDVCYVVRIGIVPYLLELDTIMDTFSKPTDRIEQIQ